MTIHKTISVSQELNDWMTSQVGPDGFADDGDYIRALIRRDQERHAKIAAMQILIDEAEESGVSPLSVREIFDEARARSVRR